MELEIERRFLLFGHNLASEMATEKEKKESISSLVITQHYLSDNSRIRRIYDVDNNILSYERTTNNKISPCVFEEYNMLIGCDDYSILSKNSCSRIDKVRTTISEQLLYPGLVFMIDVFYRLHLTVLEVEFSVGITNINDNISFPLWLEPFIITEITGNESLSNYSLSKKY